MYKLNRSSICKNYCEKICKAHLQHILTRREDKRSPREDKENDHAPKSEGADFFNTCPILEEKISTLTILLCSLGIYLSSLLVKCVEDVACKSSHNNFYKNERFNLYMFNVIYM